MLLLCTFPRQNWHGEIQLNAVFGDRRHNWSWWALLPTSLSLEVAYVWACDKVNWKRKCQFWFRPEKTWFYEATMSLHLSSLILHNLTSEIASLRDIIDAKYRLPEKSIWIRPCSITRRSPTTFAVQSWQSSSRDRKSISTHKICFFRLSFIFNYSTRPSTCPLLSPNQFSSCRIVLKLLPPHFTLGTKST